MTELKSLDERISELTRTIFDQAKIEIEMLWSEARQKETEILDKAKMDAERIHAEILTKAKNEAKLLKEEKLAEVKLSARVEAYERREKILETTLKLVKERLANITAMPEYRPALKGLVCEAIQHLQTASVILHFDPDSRKIIQNMDIERIASDLNVQISIGDELKEGVGVTAQDESGHRLFENTLSLRMERNLDKLRSIIFRQLMGEM